MLRNQQIMEHLLKLIQLNFPKSGPEKVYTYEVSTYGRCPLAEVQQYLHKY